MDVTSKIDQAKSALPVEGRMETPLRPPAKRQQPQSAKQEDVVELSSSLAGISTQELDRDQARRVAAIKAQLDAGSYRVDTRMVAQKMLTDGAGL
ncbi:flagellar biosynthesis anti-sigma factor FlgM [Geomonas terrae]|uniref:Flagellar biosynthesis anti-sigma factor FlgM n=1 Tax=Geomonas terrae TaxID=2562681 RepID=A0A4S1CBN5_9BACT|nr:flagellar biosynthesis anti-sigma factor FlgM [Geomonas terrae]TGU70775.1 flagellar biosynthesis anti-sigma factor FlgM [Geomonas terrae]